MFISIAVKISPEPRRVQGASKNTTNLGSMSDRMTIKPGSKLKIRLISHFDENKKNILQEFGSKKDDMRNF